MPWDANARDWQVGLLHVCCAFLEALAALLLDQVALQGPLTRQAATGRSPGPAAAGRGPAGAHGGDAAAAAEARAAAAPATLLPAASSQPPSTAHKQTQTGFLDTAPRVHVSPHGDCYHVRLVCEGLRSAAATSARRPCQLCVRWRPA